MTVNFQKENLEVSNTEYKDSVQIIVQHCGNWELRNWTTHTRRLYVITCVVSDTLCLNVRLPCLFGTKYRDDGHIVL